MLRVRFAPSPTGFLHVGSARTFIFNWLYARHNGGTMVLRLDDTDVERNTDASVQSIFDGLRWLGLGWDEEYKQSERLALHREMAEQGVGGRREFRACHGFDFTPKRSTHITPLWSIGEAPQWSASRLSFWFTGPGTDRGTGNEC